MYNKYTQELVNRIPELDGFDAISCRRILTKSYLFITQLRLGIDQKEIINEELLETRNVLRKLADTMENIAVFDKINGLNVPEEVEVACAFVAAEALSLLNNLINLMDENVEEEINDYFMNHKNYISMEASLLYMIGGFDINAKSMIENIYSYSTIDISDIDSLDNESCSKLLLNTFSTFIYGELFKGSTPSLQFPKISLNEKYNELIGKIRIHFYIQLHQSLEKYISWLNGDNQDGLYQSIQILNRIRLASSVDLDERNTAYSDIYHFSSILIAAIQRTQQRSLLNTIPFPDSADEQYKERFRDYLIKRVKGSVHKMGRPFMWPSAYSYVKNCLPGPKRDCVITMPTGSGKSFIAEIAMAQSLSKGWVLYLAPTNALVHQIRRDLKEELSELNVKIRSFVGGEEYTTLSEEYINFEEKFVAVMTPEKCALALRLYPQQFKNCSLCIFDECHLINDKQRGTNADILLTRLLDLADNIKLLLMSAMISNGQELSNWLKGVHDQNAVCEQINWRPTRTLRSIVALNGQDIIDNYKVYKVQANELPKNKKNVYFDCSLLLFSGLSGPWTLDGATDYKLSQVPMSFPIRVSKDGVRPYIDSWKNTASRIVSEKLANSGLPVINFILSSKHHAFSSAGRISEDLEGSVGTVDNLPDLVKCYLTIADNELGLTTILWKHFSQGIAVHSSSMLQVEQAASEYIFMRGKARLMFATGTLAQGLNLPAVAVVVAGTTMGDPRETDDIYGVNNDRAKSTILNAFGRAGRPGFGHQGIAILVPDDPQAMNTNEISSYTGPGSNIMREPDASIEVNSPIENFIDRILNDEYNIEFASIEELTLTSLLAELDNENNIGKTLGKTFGAFKKSGIVTEESLELARQRILKVKSDFLESPDVPDWLNLATMKAGVDFFRSQSMWEAYLKRSIINPNEYSSRDILDWLSVFFEVLTHMHPRFFKFYPSEEIRTETVLTKMRDYVQSNNLLYKEKFELTTEWKELWEELEHLVRLYMSGGTYKEIAEKLLDKEVITNGRSSGANPLPAVFKFIKDVIEPIAADAGCFLALNELGVYHKIDDPIPEGLQGLPIAIRYGCHDLGTLSWFRFGFRQRICAHSLNEVFPVPTGLLYDDARARWVRKARRDFLSYPSEDSFLECIRKIIIQET